MTTECIEYDTETNIVARERFADVESAQEWATARRGEPIFWGDTQLGFQGMTEADIDNFARTSIHPAQWFELHGIDEEGEIREIEESDYRDGEYPETD